MQAAGDPGVAQFVVTDGSGTVLTASNVNQDNANLGSFINGGTVTEISTGVTITAHVSNGNTTYTTVTQYTTVTDSYAPTYNENEVGQFVATGGTAVVTMAAMPNSGLILNTAVLVPIGFNDGTGDNFHVQTGSPAIDAGDPTTPFVQEPSPNGGRVNLGYDGDTSQAQVSASGNAINVLSPGGLAKYEIGEQLPINFETTGLTNEQPVLLLHAGGSSIATALQGNWSADAFRTDGQSVTDTNTAAQIGTLANVPTALFSSAADIASATAGQQLTFDLPVANGTYTLNLYFADPSASGTGQRVFNIVANGQTLQADYDIFAAAKTQYGEGDHAVSLTFTVIVTGGQGLTLDFVNVAGSSYGALVNGIALEQANAAGSASPTATVEVSTDGGTTWSTIASGVSINSYGQGQYVWTVNQTSNGNTALVQVLSSTGGQRPIVTTGTSQPFLLANSGNIFYVAPPGAAYNPSEAQYTVAPGNDANSGKSPDQPMASLAALLRAYPIGPGATILVDAGTYTLATDINLPAADSGSAASPLLITGPTDGATATFNRNNQATGTDVFDLLGISNLTIQNLTIEGAYDGVDLTNATAVTLQNVVVANNMNVGVNAAYGAGVISLAVNNSIFVNNGSIEYGYGIYFGYNNTGISLLNDQVYDTFGTGLYLDGNGSQSVQGGSYYNNNGDGIDANTVAVIEDVVAYGNSNGNGADGIYLTAGTVTGNTVFGNVTDGINASNDALVTDNLVYDQDSTSVNSVAALDVGSNSTAIGNTTYGDHNGIWVGSASIAEDNLSYDNTADGMYYTGYPPAAISGNTIYSNATGLAGFEYYDGPTIPITGNLIYQNSVAGIALVGGTNQQIINNTIDQPTGTAISLGSDAQGAGTTTTIENNIIAVAAGPAVSVAPTAESGFVSDYNFYDLTGTGAIASWENVSYTALATWYYATGEDQHSQVGNPDFVDPAGPDGILGFSGQSGTPLVVTAGSASGFSTTGVWTPYTAGTGGAGATALQTAAGSGGTANFAFNGLTPGAVYQVAVNWPSNFITNEGNNATFVVQDAHGVVLATGQVNQYDAASTGIAADGAGFVKLGVITATTTSVTVTLSGTGGALVIADAVLVQAVGGNGGGDDDFHLQAGSPAIDAGNPSTVYNLELAPNGGRVNQGYDGDTSQAQTSSAAQTLQVLNPAQFGKYEVGEQVPIDTSAVDFGQTQAVLTLNAGGPAIATPTLGNWQASADQLTGTTFTNTASVTGLNDVPTALFATGADLTGATAGQALNFDLAVAPGTYTLRLYFAEPTATAVGQRVFNILANGATLVSNYDVFKAAGGKNTAVELDLTVTAGKNGIDLSLVNVSGSYGAFVNAIELDQTLPSGVVSPTANIDVSTNDGQSWSLIATGVPINRYGQAQYVWTVDRTTTGSTALIQVTSGSVVATSQPFLLANGGTSFYIAPPGATYSSATAQYTTAAGNDANSGKSPDQPMTSLAALLRAYPIGPGDTIYVDTGNYVASSDAVLGAADAGTTADPALIIGPTNGGTVVLDRNNTSAGIGVIDVIGGANVTVENLELTGAAYGIDFTSASTGMTLENDSIFGNAVGGIFTDNNQPPSIANLTIEDSAIYDNIGPGISLQDGVASALLLNDLVYDNTSNLGDGIDAVSLNGTVTITGGAVDDNSGTGIYARGAVTIDDAQVHGNAKDGIDASVYTTGVPLIVSGNTVYSNAGIGIDSSGAMVTGNTVYDQVVAGDPGIDMAQGSTASYNTVYGSSVGLSAGSGAQILDNVIYQSIGDGITLTAGSGYTVTGNILYGNAAGIGVATGSTTLDDNLVYNNVSTGIAINGGATITVVNNTVYQPIGQALTLSSGSAVTIENNILWVNEGDVIGVAAGGATGFLSAYNLFYQGANATPATLGIWEGTAEATLANWQAASGKDVNGSKTGNPDFVNMAGANQILGGPGTAVGAGADDDFELQKGSPAIDAANAYVAPFTDLLGQPRADDPGTTNTGIGYPLYVQSNGAATSPPAKSGMTLLFQSDGGVTTYNFPTSPTPFTFSFYGVTYTSVLVSSQGYLQFAGPNTSGYDTPSLANLTAAARIAPFWANFYTEGTGDGVFVSTTSTSVTFEWVGFAPTGGGTVNFSVTLNSNGSFTFDYGAGNAGFQTASPLGAPVIGVSAGNHQVGAQPVYVLSTASGSASLANALSQTWTPQAGDTYFDTGAFEFQGNSNNATPPAVVSISNIPANNGTTGLAFTSLAVQFSEALDWVSANSPANYSLIEADSNGQFDTTGATVIPVTPVYTLGSTTVTLELPDGALATGVYQLTLSGTGAIFDQSSNALAGNGTTAGTNYVTDFTINRTADVAPVATAQSVSVAENASTQVVLAATDTQGNSLTYSIVTPPADGGVSAITNGNTLTYTPLANFYGADSFVFQATDPDGESSQATVSVTVTPVNQPPVAIAQSLSVVHDAPQVIVLGGTDNNETPSSQLTYTITTQPAHGVLVQSATSPDTFIYTPAAGYVGADSFSFTVTDTGNPPGNLANAKTSAPATVSLSVVDPAPAGVPVTYTTRENVPLTVPAAQGVLAGDTDSAGDNLTATLQTTVAQGTLVLNSNGSFTYTPPASYTGTVTFTYVPHGTYTAGSATTVTIVVGQGAGASPPPPAPPAPGGTGKVASAPPGLPGAGAGGGGGATGETTGAVAETTGASAGTAGASAGTAGASIASAAASLGTAGDNAGTAASTGGTAASETGSAGGGSAGGGYRSAVSPVSAQSVASVVPPVFAPAAPGIAWSSGLVPMQPAPVVADSSPMVPPDPSNPGTDPDTDPAGLLSAPDPIVLPDFILADDPGFALMLPASPEIAQLPQAFARAAQRLAEQSHAIITFVDPVTGEADDDDAFAGQPGSSDMAWLLFDSDSGARTDAATPQIPPQILWDSAPP